MKIKKFLKKLYQATTYSGTTIHNHQGKPLTCFFCNLPIGFVRGFNESLAWLDDYHANGIPTFTGWKGDCYRCAIDHNLHRTETIWNSSKTNINGYRLTLIHNKKFYLIDYNLFSNSTAAYEKREKTGYHLALQMPGLIFTPQNALKRFPTILTFS